MGRLQLIKELFIFLIVRKKWWLLPIVLFLILLSALIVCIFNAPVAPVLYPLF